MDNAPLSFTEINTSANQIVGNSTYDIKENQTARFQSKEPLYRPSFEAAMDAEHFEQLLGTLKELSKEIVVYVGSSELPSTIGQGAITNISWGYATGENRFIKFSIEGTL